MRTAAKKNPTNSKRVKNVSLALLASSGTHTTIMLTLSFYFDSKKCLSKVVSKEWSTRCQPWCSLWSDSHKPSTIVRSTPSKLKKKLILMSQCPPCKLTRSVCSNWSLSSCKWFTHSSLNWLYVLICKPCKPSITWLIHLTSKTLPMNSWRLLSRSSRRTSQNPNPKFKL